MKSLLSTLDSHLGQKGKTFLSGDKVMAIKLLLIKIKIIIKSIIKTKSWSSMNMMQRLGCLTWCSGPGSRDLDVLVSSTLAWRSMGTMMIWWFYDDLVMIWLYMNSLTIWQHYDDDDDNWWWWIMNLMMTMTMNGDSQIPEEMVHLNSWISAMWKVWMKPLHSWT